MDYVCLLSLLAFSIDSLMNASGNIPLSILRQSMSTVLTALERSGLMLKKYK